MADTLEETLYDLARDALAHQAEQVADLRRRAGTLIAASTLTNSVFAAVALNHGGFTPIAIVALAGLALVLACGLFVLSPHRLIFIFDFDDLTRLLWKDRNDMPTVHRRLGDIHWRMRHKNLPRVNLLHRVFAAGTILLGVDVALWGAAIVT